MGKINSTHPIRNPKNDERDARFKEQTGKTYREWHKELGGKAIRKLRKKAKRAEKEASNVPRT